MKRSDFGKLVRLTKQYIDEEKMWGQAEVMLEKMMKRRQAEQQAPSPAADAGDRTAMLAAFRKEVGDCRKCTLGKGRLNLVFGTGSAEARLMFIGEGPGFDEDHKGEPFIGKAGQLLTKIIESIGLQRSEVYIANAVKCHPMIDPTDPEKRGNDRPPRPEEVEACLPYLEKQIEIIRPKVICVLGNSAVKALLQLPTGISKLRGTFLEYRGSKVMPTYHPAALLRDPSLKRDVWEDMKKIKAELCL